MKYFIIYSPKETNIKMLTRKKPSEEGFFLGIVLF